MSSLLIPTLILLGLFNFIPWVSSLYDTNFGYLPMSSVNNIFFDEFFQLLIIVDVMLLIFSFFQLRFISQNNAKFWLYYFHNINSSFLFNRRTYQRYSDNIFLNIWFVNFTDIQRMRKKRIV